MATGDNLMGIALEITANPDQAAASIEALQAKVNELSQQVGKSGEAYTKWQAASKALWDAQYEAAQRAVQAQKSVQESAQSTAASYAEQARVEKAAATQELEQLGLVKDAWMQNAAAAREYGASLTQGDVAQSYADVATQMDAMAASEEAATAGGADFAAVADTIGVRMGTMGEQAQAAARGTSMWHSMNQGVIGDLRLMRYAMYAFTTPMMFAYVIPQLEKVVEWIDNGIQALEGYDSELKAVEADARAASEAALTSFGELNSSTLLRLSLISDVNQRNRETLQLEVQRSEKQLADLRGQLAEVNQLRQAKQELRDLDARMSAEAASGMRGAPDEVKRQLELVKEIHSLESELGPTLSGDLGKAAKTLADDLDKGNKALTGFQVRLNELKEAPQKAAVATNKAATAQDRWNESIATAQVKLPPYISEIDRLQKALLVPNASENNNLFAYAELNAERLQEGLKPLEATLQQLGIATPSMQIPGIPAALLNQQLNAVRQLSEAERMQLPTERELQLANQQLAREYPQLTAAEREHWAQVMLTSQAYRDQIDAGTKVRSSNAELSSSFRSLSMQVRTAFSEMAGQITGWGGVATRVFDQVFNAVSRQIEIERQQAAAHQIAQFSMIKATVDGFKQLAPVRAAIDLAKGFEALGDFNFWSATQYFAGAALWGTVAAFQIASMAGAFSPGSAGTKTAASAGTAASATASTTTTPALASGSASAAARQANQQQTYQIIFQGPVYGGKAGAHEIVNEINSGVKFNRWQLNASHNPTGAAL